MESWLRTSAWGRLGVENSPPGSAPRAGLQVRVAELKQFPASCKGRLFLGQTSEACVYLIHRPGELDIDSVAIAFRFPVSAGC